MSSPFSAALARRRSLLQNTQCFRAFSGDAEGMPGVFVDVYGPVATLIIYEGPATAHLSPKQLATDLLTVLSEVGVQAIYFKPFAKDRSRMGGQLPKVVTEATPLAGKRVDEAVLVQEHGVTLEIRPYDGLSTGLFLDQRPNRAYIAKLIASRLAKEATRKRDGTSLQVRAALGETAAPTTPQRKGVHLLNMFAYTCAFSVYAAKVGATTTSVDVSAKYLDWGKRNFTHNGLDPKAHRFARMDTFEFITYALRKGLRYDAIILDPPSFAAGNKRKGIKPWSSASDYPKLVHEVIKLLEPQGLLFASTNTLELCFKDKLARTVLKGLGKQPKTWLELPPPGADTAMQRDKFACVACIVA
jgi:23S rRNA (cytosine1962-C5)-methyltransferase